MKKVLIFSLNYHPFIGGAEVAIKEITDRISPEEMEFHLIAPWYDSVLPKEEKIGNVTVLNLNKKLYQLLAVWEAERLHRIHNFDGIWAMIAHSCAIPAGIFKHLHPKVKYLLTLQEGDPPEYIERLMKPVWPLFVQGFVLADALQPISNFLLAWGKKMGFKGDARVVPNAVDTARFGKTFSTDEMQTMKGMLGKKEGDVFLVTTSRLVHKNGVDTVIRALPLLPENVSFLIYGVGPDEAMLRALAHKLGVKDRARFMGEISHAEMPHMLAACDIFVRPSRSEGMGNSFIEAMAAGLPVIATQQGGIADFLFDAKRNPDQKTTGWAVDAEAPEQITQAVEAILTDPAGARVVAVTARTMVQERYEWNTVAHEMQRLFQDLLGTA
jgi:glycosyltransferase involved in cell wall biosynthesis